MITIKQNSDFILTLKKRVILLSSRRENSSFKPKTLKVEWEYFWQKNEKMVENQTYAWYLQVRGAWQCQIKIRCDYDQ